MTIVVNSLPRRKKRRIDITLYKPGQGDYGSDWKCYVQAVTPMNATHIIAALERDGETVRAFTHSKTIGQLVYETTAS